jgi:hypothetical protein
VPRFCLLLFLFAGLIPGPSAPAQSAPAVAITLGQSLVPLNGPWKFHSGANPQWAGPNFDDSAWETVDLTTKEGSFDPEQGTRGFVPGWTAKGHPGYSGYAWYRLRVRIDGADGPLALRAPVNVDDVYQVFANGRLIGSFGDFRGSVPAVYTTRPLMFTIPASVRQRGQNGTIELAFRFFMAPRTLRQINGPGGMHDPPLLGLAPAVAAAWHVAWEAHLKGIFPILASALIYLVFSLLILMLYAFDRAEKIVLWPLAACALSALGFSLIAISVSTLMIPELPYSILRSVLNPITGALWILTWLAYFGLSGKIWLRNLIVVLVLWDIASDLFFQILTLNGPRIPHFVFSVFAGSSFAAHMASLVLLALIVYFGIRKARRVDWMLLLALIFSAIPYLNPVLNLLRIPPVFFPFGMQLPLALLAEIAALFCFSFVLMRHFRASQRRQQAMIHDVKQAQEVQQVLIPEKLPQVPGLAIESEYRPASEVGGDFFQIIPHASDGSALIVAGDVTGKGLQAGMLVALIVGTIRTVIEKSFEPLDLLEALNRRLCERGNAHATCLALRISADGAVTLANAGHMPPYLNGKELPMQGAVPLGMLSSADFASMRFQLAPNDRLMLLSDGVAEAQDEQGRLFGFDRIQALLAGPISAAEIASAAQKFGQHDDISIVSITRTAVLEEALA